jgi:hypothetical protein
MKKMDHTLLEHETYIHRRDDCGFYDRCLDKAAVKRWPSFSCVDCRDFKQESTLFLRIRKASSLAGETL